MRYNFWTPKSGANQIRILPSIYSGEDFFLENTEYNWVLMNVMIDPNFFEGIQVWKTDVNVLYHILTWTQDKKIGNVSDLLVGRNIGVLVTEEEHKKTIKISINPNKSPIDTALWERYKAQVPNLREVDAFLMQKKNRWRRIVL